MIQTLLVGEAWGKREAQFQHPLVGPTGRELALLLGISKFAPHLRLLCRKCKHEVEYILPKCPICEEFLWPNEFHLIDHWKRLFNDFGIAVTNVFQMQPPQNKLGYLFGKVAETDMPPYRANQEVGGTHLLAQHRHHITRLYREVETLKPTLVLALGNAACWALLYQTKISELRGTVTWSEQTHVKILPTYHPAAVLRQQSLRPTVLADFTKACREREFPEIRRPERWLTVPSPDENGIQEIYNWFKKPARAYSNDIETYRNMITMTGFARSRDDAIVIPFRRPKNEFYWRGPTENDINYWPTKALEVAAWKGVIHGLDTPQDKIFQNGVFDMSHYIRMGIHVRNPKHDTMLWHHSEYPELPKSLGYLGSIYCNEVAWKQMPHGESSKRDE